MTDICPERGEEIGGHEKAEKKARKIDPENASKDDCGTSGARRGASSWNIWTSNLVFLLGGWVFSRLSEMQVSDRYYKDVIYTREKINGECI